MGRPHDGMTKRKREDVVAERQSNATARLLRRATVVEAVFLVISGFFLFTEHRAHYLSALPYALLIIAATALLWFQAERKRERRSDETPQVKGRS